MTTVTTVNDSAGIGFDKRDANYNTAWVAAACDSLYTPNTAVGQYPVGPPYIIWRAALIFDTSLIPAGSIISAAKLRIYGAADGSTQDFNITVQNGQPTYPHNPVVVGDYDKANCAGSGGTLTTVGFIVGGYNDIVLDATGRGWITLGGFTKLYLRSSLDISGTAPAVPEYVQFQDHTQANPPQIEVTWTPGVSRMPALRRPLCQIPMTARPLGVR